MNIKVKAALATAAFLGGAFITAGLVQIVIERMTAEQIGYTVGAISVAALIYAVYGVILSRMEYNDTVAKLQKD